MSKSGVRQTTDTIARRVTPTLYQGYQGSETAFRPHYDRGTGDRSNVLFLNKNFEPKMEYRARTSDSASSWMPSIRRTSLTVFGIMVIVLALFALHARSSAKSSSFASTQIYIVKPYDTIWGIATKFSDGGDPSYLEDRIVSELGTPTIFPGERIVIP